MLCYQSVFTELFIYQIVNKIKWLKPKLLQNEETQKRLSFSRALSSLWNAGHPARNLESSLNQWTVKPLWISRRFWESLKMSISKQGQGIGSRNPERNPRGKSSVTRHARPSSRRGKRGKWLWFHRLTPLPCQQEYRQEILEFQRLHHLLKLRLRQPASFFPSRIQNTSGNHLKR